MLVMNPWSCFAHAKIIHPKPKEESMLIIAIDLGKFNSVACLYNTQTQKQQFETLATDRGFFEKLFKTYNPDLVDAPASEAAAVMDQIGAKLENSKTILGVVAQSVRALPSQHLRNSESGFQNLTSNLSWPGVGRDHRCRWMHFSADIEQNLMGSARLTEANP